MDINGTNKNDLINGTSFRALDGNPSTQVEKTVKVTIDGKPLVRPDGRQLMFAADGMALSAALTGIEHELDRALRLDERALFYMPLMHSEQLSLQERCVQLYRNLANEVTGSARATMLSRIGFAERHRDIVRKFGRFPHRNALLGRECTPEELDFLELPNSAF